MEFIRWCARVLDAKESESFGRTGAAFVITFLAIAGGYITIKTTTLPDVPYGWASIVGILWGVTGFKEAYIKGKEASSGSISNPVAPNR
jgi:hypothetical protein